MSLADLSADLTASLHDAAEVFVDAGDVARLLNTAAQDFNRHRPRTLVGEFSVEIDRLQYPAAEGIYLYKSSLWGHAPRVNYWDRAWPGPAPDVTLIDGMLADGSPGKLLQLSLPPSWKQISAFGNDFRYFYLGCHVIGAEASGTTLNAGDRFLLLLRAQAEAMREMMMRNIKKPVQMRDGLQSAPRNMTPAALYEQLMKEWEMKVKGLAV